MNAARAALRPPRAPAADADQAGQADDDLWVDACAVTDIVPGTAVCALIRQRQVAIFRPATGPDLYALENFDPFSKANVLARGIVGDRGGVLKVASPIFKQSFALKTGVCLEDASVRVATFATRISVGRVQIRISASPVVG